MDIPKNLLNLGFTRYEAQVYLALITDNPLNGSQLSRVSGVPRANIYNVLDGMRSREIVTEVSKGLYVPIPPDELDKRLRAQRDRDLDVLKTMTDEVKIRTNQEYVWTIIGYEQVMAKAREMIASAERELFIRLFPQEGERLKQDLKQAEARGVEIKYVSFGPVPVEFEYQVVHPENDSLTKAMDGRAIDIVADDQVVITGRLRSGLEKNTRVAWANNHWLAFSIRDALRHDFYHVFLHKIHELGEPLSQEEAALYRLIKKDFWETT